LFGIPYISLDAVRKSDRRYAKKYFEYKQIKDLAVIWWLARYVLKGRHAASLRLTK